MLFSFSQILESGPGQKNFVTSIRIYNSGGHKERDRFCLAIKQYTGLQQLQHSSLDLNILDPTKKSFPKPLILLQFVGSVCVWGIDKQIDNMCCGRNG